MPFACADRCLPVLTHTALVSHSLHALHSLLSGFTLLACAALALVLLPPYATSPYPLHALWLVLTYAAASTLLARAAHLFACTHAAPDQPPPHSFHWLHSRVCSHMLLPPHSLHALPCRPCGQLLRIKVQRRNFRVGDHYRVTWVVTPRQAPASSV